MKIERQKDRLDVHDSDLSGSVFDDVNMSGWRAHDVNLSGLRIGKANLAGATILGGRMEGMTIEAISVVELIAFRRAAHEANPT